MIRIMEYVRKIDTKKNPLDQPGYFLYAYCIMDNHIHLLIQPHEQSLAQTMKRIMTTYAIYFNNTYLRVGHLFQDRFRSEVIEDKDYFFTVVRYIHNNPVKAGIVKHIGDYKYSSAIEYLAEKRYGKGQSPIVSFCGQALCNFPEISSALEIEKEYKRHAQQEAQTRMRSMNLLMISREDIQEMVQSNDSTPSMNSLFDRLKQKVQGSDSELCRIIRERLDWQTAEEKDNAIVEMLLEMTGSQSISEFQQLDKKTLRSALAVVRDSGIGDHRLSRLTGVSRGVIQRAKVYPK